jgi:hypothetical protein
LNTILHHYANILSFNYNNKGLITKSRKCSQQLMPESNLLPVYKKASKIARLRICKKNSSPIIERYLIIVENKLITILKHASTPITTLLPLKIRTAFSNDWRRK